MRRTVVPIGLPKTGKTTFLAAFWDVVDSGAVTGSLSLLRTTGDMEYLNEIRQAWADCKEITRTGPASDKPVSMLIGGSGDVETQLEWTDMLGESFEQQWSERACTPAYDLLIKDAVGLLLFVHPGKVHEPPLIMDGVKAARRMLAANAKQEAQQQQGEQQGKEAAAPPKPDPYDPRKAPTQVQLVDLLQFILYRRQSDAPMNVSVVISAWDLVLKAPSPPEPAEWLDRRLPLLAQFLNANAHLFRAKVYGVSAQGGDYKDAAALRKRYRASDRIIVASGKQQWNDITLPVQWSIGV